MQKSNKVLSPQELRDMCLSFFHIAKDCKRRKDYTLLKRVHVLATVAAENSHVTQQTLSHFLPLPKVVRVKNRIFPLSEAWFHCKDIYEARVLLREDIKPDVLPMYLHWLTGVLIPTNYAWTGEVKPHRKLFIWEIEPLLPLDWERIAYL